MENTIYDKLTPQRKLLVDAILSEGKVPSEIIEEFVAAIVPEEDGKHFSWYLTLDDEEYHQSLHT